MQTSFFLFLSLAAREKRKGMYAALLPEIYSGWLEYVPSVVSDTLRRVR